MTVDIPADALLRQFALPRSQEGTPPCQEAL